MDPEAAASKQTPHSYIQTLKEIISHCDSPNRNRKIPSWLNQWEVEILQGREEIPENMDELKLNLIHSKVAILKILDLLRKIDRSRREFKRYGPVDYSSIRDELEKFSQVCGDFQRLIDLSCKIGDSVLAKRLTLSKQILFSAVCKLRQEIPPESDANSARRNGDLQGNGKKERDVCEVIDEDGTVEEKSREDEKPPAPASEVSSRTTREKGLGLIKPVLAVMAIVLAASLATWMATEAIQDDPARLSPKDFRNIVDFQSINFADTIFIGTVKNSWWAKNNLQKMKCMEELRTKLAALGFRSAYIADEAGKTVAKLVNNEIELYE